MAPTLTKAQLHQLFQDDVAYIANKQKNLALPLACVYETAILLLQELDQTIFEDIPREQRIQMKKSLSMFGVKELAVHDKEGSVDKRVAQLGFQYGKTFGLIDPLF